MNWTTEYTSATKPIKQFAIDTLVFIPVFTQHLCVDIFSNFMACIYVCNDNTNTPKYSPSCDIIRHFLNSLGSVEMRISKEYFLGEPTISALNPSTFQTNRYGIISGRTSAGR